MKQRGDWRGAGLFLLGLAAASCTSLLGIDEDYHKPDGGTGSAGESCVNHQDDDSDGAVDCADADCAAVAVCAAVPERWTLIWKKEEDPSQPRETCPDGSMGIRYFIEPAGPPQCEACSCGVPENARCTAPEITCYHDSLTCSGTVIARVRADDASCVNVPDVPFSGINGSCSISAPAQPIEGSCRASGGTMMSSPPWGGAIVVCDLNEAADGCEAGERCVSQGDAKDGAVCIKSAEATVCPEGWPKATTAYGEGEDLRGCSPCGCSIECRDGSYTVYDGDNCSVEVAMVTQSQGCVTAVDTFDAYQASLQAILATPVAICSESQGMGQVIPMGTPQLICCK